MKKLFNADLRTIQAALFARYEELYKAGRTEAANCCHETLGRIIALNVGDSVVIESLPD